MKQKLTSARLGRAERLTDSIRTKYGLPNSGSIIIESWSDGKLIREHITHFTSFRDYLLSLGNFTPVNLDNVSTESLCTTTLSN